MSNNTQVVDNEPNVIQDVTVGIYPEDTKLYKKIANIRKLDLKQVREILKYNIVSMDQLALITGKSVAHLTNCSTPKLQKEGLSWQLNICYPFPGTGRGFKFVYRDESCERYILKKLKLDK